MKGLLGSDVISLVMLVSSYYNHVPQFEEHLGVAFDTVPTIERAVPTIGAREYEASYHFANKHITIHPEARPGRKEYLIAHELGHHHFNEQGFGDEWATGDEWTRFLSEVYAEWTGCSYAGTCTYYQTGGLEGDTFEPGEIPRPTFFLKMQELFEEGRLEMMMNNPTTIPPADEWCEEMRK